MSRNSRRREEPSPLSREPAYTSRSHRESSEYSRGRTYAPPTEYRSRRNFNYWRDEGVAPASHHSQGSYRREDYGEHRYDDGRSRWSESSFSRRRHDRGPGRDWDDRKSWRDRSLLHGNFPPWDHSMHTPPYRVPQHTFHVGSPTEPLPLDPPPPLKASSRSSNSPKPLKPSPAYLSLSQEPSNVLHDPGSTRKLLVLDLNGTLLIRSARSRAISGQQLRAVQPRPYMLPFRQYLFCPETKAWLDTMVWSSAQPHSVEDMVDKVFGTTKSELKAVWNRQSLGLSEANYHRKTVTTKDLTKSWDFLASSLQNEKPKEHSAVSSRSQIIHSARTTLLLDDSPHKAALQPYNHVCIPEYDSARRRHDLRSFVATKEPKDGKKNKKAKRKDQNVAASRSIDQNNSEFSPSGVQSELAEKDPYDAALLAVIGILEAVKFQSNAAGWICKGGLWAGQERLPGKGGIGNDAISASDLTGKPEQARLQTNTWFNDPSVFAHWVTQGRRTLIQLGIQVVHGVTG